MAYFEQIQIKGTTGNIAEVNASNELKVSGAFTLPTGASTEAKQDTEITALGTLNTSVNTLLKPADTLTKVTTVDTITNPVAVTGTFFQATQPVSATALPLPTGAATETTVATLLTDTQLRATPVPVSGTMTITGVSTEAKQDTQITTLNSIDTKLTSPLTVQATDLDIRDLAFATDKVDVSGSAVTVATLPLPTGAATSANQTTEITALGTLDTSVNTLLKPASTLAAVTTVGTITNALPTGTNTIGNVNQTLATNGFTRITDGTNTMTVKAASTAPVVADIASVVTLSPNVSTVATALAKAEDNAHVSADVGVMSLGVRRDTNVIATSTDGDYSLMAVDTYGNQRCVGDVLHDTADNLVSAPQKIAGVAITTTYPTATAAGDVTRLATDPQGRLVVANESSRGLRVFGQATLNTTAETTIIAGAGGTLFTDVAAIVIGNLGAGNENITFRFGVGGTIFAVVASLANTSQTISFPVPIPATAVNLAVTATMSANAATGVSVTVVGVRNQ